MALIAAAISAIVFVTYNFWFHRPFEKAGIPTFVLTIVIFVLTIVCLIFVCLKKKEENAQLNRKIVNIFSSIFSLASIISILLPTTLFLAQERQFKYFFYGEHDLEITRKIVVHLYIGSSPKVVVPSSVDKYPVYGISGPSFLLNENLLYVIVSQGIEFINRSFVGCSNLTTLFIPRSVNYIGNGSISGCPNLTVYCEAESQPSGWSEEWNRDNVPVVWGARIKDL